MSSAKERSAFLFSDKCGSPTTAILIILFLKELSFTTIVTSFRSGVKLPRFTKKRAARLVTIIRKDKTFIGKNYHS